jgi:hypothetical protein
LGRCLPLFPAFLSSSFAGHVESGPEHHVFLAFGDDYEEAEIGYGDDGSDFTAAHRLPTPYMIG